MVKNLPDHAGDVSSIPGLIKFPGEGNSNPCHYSCLTKSYRQRHLVQSMRFQRVRNDWAHPNACNIPLLISNLYLIETMCRLKDNTFLKLLFEDREVIKKTSNQLLLYNIC